MRRAFNVLLFGLLSVLCLAAHAGAGTERGALFKATLDGHVMHLFGTLHVGLPEFYPLEPRVMAALAEASTLALEIVPDQPHSDLLRALRSHGMLAQGEGYGAMPAAQRQRLDALMRAGGIDAGTVLAYKPVLLATMLTLAEYTRQGYRTDLSSEAFLARQARNNRMRVIELESLGAQLAMLDRLAEADRWRFLEEMMGTIESGAQRVEANTMVRAWATADRRALDDIAARCEADTSVSGRFVTQVLLKERNAAIADKLVRLLQGEDKTMAAIGVLHLLGNGSVPELLRARGVSVERIY